MLVSSRSSRLARFGCSQGAARNAKARRQTSPRGSHVAGVCRWCAAAFVGGMLRPVTLPVTVENDPALAPGYLRTHVRTPEADSAADLLADGDWCGHGEPRYRVFELQDQGDAVLHLSLPVEDEMDGHEPLA